MSSLGGYVDGSRFKLRYLVAWPEVYDTIELTDRVRRGTARRAWLYLGSGTVLRRYVSKRLRYDSLRNGITTVFTLPLAIASSQTRAFACFRGTAYLGAAASFRTCGGPSVRVRAR